MPGPDEITNLVLKKTFPITQQHLLALAQSSINTRHFPTAFKTTTTVILRKQAKPDYTKPNAYRPIALEKTLGKLLESIMAEILSYLAETYNLLPVEHFGGRPGRTAEDAMIVLSERIHQAWKRKEIFSAVFMDVAGAFNNVHHQRLMHNMREKRIPNHIVEWMESFLKDRTTELRFNGTTSKMIRTEAGVPQGSPLSPILYMFYNGDLLKVPRMCGENDGMSLGFIDDIAYGVQGLTAETNSEKLQNMLEKAEEWRIKHGSKFETSKYVLIHFTRNHNLEITAPVSIAGVTIHPSNEARYLGVIFDKGLRFKHHLQYIAKKGAKFSLALSRIAKAGWGPQFRYLRQLFTAVIAPRMDYGACIWHKPTRYGQYIPPSSISKLETAQRTALKAILGCFRTTPTAALERETALAPPHLRLQSKILRTLTRMQTLPEQHPTKICVERAAKSNSKTFVSNLEYLLRVFPDYTEPTEIILPYVRPPWWNPTHQISIGTDKDAAKKSHDETTHGSNTIRIYTDGSGINGHVGAAAYSPELAETKSQYLGSEAQFNVYAAEVTAINMAVDIAKKANETIKHCIIYADSQPAIIATTKPVKQSGQSIIAETLKSLESLQEQKPDLKVSIIWIPGHMDIPGNEKADEEAKKAATSTQSRRTPFNHNPLKSARNRTVKEKSNREWEQAWKNRNHNSRFLRRITTKPNVEKGPKLYNCITKRGQISQLARLRTGHCPLNQYLHRFNIEDSPLCECGSGAIETVEHYLLLCNRYDKERAALIAKVGVGGMWIERLLGHPKLIGHTLEFVKSTKRM